MNALEEMMDSELWVDDLYDMDQQQLQAEADRYENMARFGPDAKKVQYRFAYYRHREAMKLLNAINGGES